MEQSLAIAKNSDWYGALLEEFQATWVEQNKTISWTILSRNHGLGKMIREAADEHKIGITQLIDNISVDMKCSDRLLWQCVQFVEKFPTLEELVSKLPGDKVMNWTTVRQELGDQKQLTAPSFSAEDVAKKLFNKYGKEDCLKIKNELIILINEAD